MCKNALERERVYTHLSREYGNGFFFFPLFCFRVLQSKPSHIPMTFLGGKHIIFLILIKPTTSSNFFSFFLLHTCHILYTKIDVAIKGKNSFTHTHTHTLTRSLSRIRLACPAPCTAGCRRPYGRRCCSDTASVAVVARHCSGRREEADIPGQQQALG